MAEERHAMCESALRTSPSTATHASMLNNEAYELLFGMQPARLLQPLVAAIDRYSIWLTAARGMMGEETTARESYSAAYVARQAYTQSGPNSPMGAYSLTHENFQKKKKVYNRIHHHRSTERKLYSGILSVLSCL